MDPFTFELADLIDIRRFCGFASAGIPGSWNPDAGDYRLAVFEARTANLTEAEGELLVDKHLARCRATEDAYWSAADTLVVESADVFTRNPRHLAELKEQHRDARMAMCAAFGIAPGPALQSVNGTRLIQMRV